MGAKINGIEIDSDKQGLTINTHVDVLKIELH